VPSPGLLRSFVALWWVLGAAIFVGSIQTVLSARHGTHGPNVHLVVLASAEALAALLFLFPRTLRPGAIGLLLVLAVAFVTHLARRELRWDLLIYGAAVLFVAVHGTLSTAQWRHLWSRQEP